MKAAREIVTSDGAVLRVGVIADGEVLTRVGNTAVGSTAGGGGGAPTTATYVTLSTNATLTNERVLTEGTGIDLADGGAGGNLTITVDLSEISAGGDLTGTMNAPTLSAGAVTLAKMADIATDRLIGRDTAGTGAPEALTVSGGVEFSGAGGILRSALTGDVTAAAGSGSVVVDQARGLRETSGPTTLTMAGVVDLEALIRSGTTVTSRAFQETHIYDGATSTTLVPPSWALYCVVQVQSGGGGGASGLRSALAVNAQGGGGASAGCYHEHKFDIASLPTDKTLTIEVGAAGVGGAGTSVNGTANNGTDASPAYVADSDGTKLSYARGGAGGGSGASNFTAGSLTTGFTQWDGSNGGQGSNVGIPTPPTTSFRYSPAGGGGGGGITTGNLARDGATGGWGGNGFDPAGTTNGGAGGTTAGTRNGSAAAGAKGRRPPGGGGGGAAGAGDGSVNGGDGGDGLRGSGGGGGGAAHAPATTGGGGDGGAGWIIVTFYG